MKYLFIVLMLVCSMSSLLYSEDIKVCGNTIIEPLFSHKNLTFSSYFINYKEQEIVLTYKDGSFVFEKGNFELFKQAMEDEDWFTENFMLAGGVSSGFNLIRLYQIVKEEQQIALVTLKKGCCPVCGSEERLTYSSNGIPYEDFIRFKDDLICFEDEVIISCSVAPLE